MLLLTRRVGEVIMIGDEVAVRVLGVNGNQVRLGIDAPKTVPVHRLEVFERIQREEQVTSSVAAFDRTRSRESGSAGAA